MTEKQIFRAANKFRNTLLQKTECSIRSVRSRIKDETEFSRIRLDRLTNWMRILNGKSTDTCRTIIQSTTSDQISDIKFSMEAIKRIVGGLEKLAAPSLREIVDEIQGINSAWYKIQYRNNELSVLIRHVVLEDDNEEVNLGNFWIRFNLKDASFSIESVDKIKSSGGYVHPHVSGSDLCTGDGADLIQDAICQGRLEDVFRLIEAILRTYNGASPYESLQEWYDPEGGYICPSCEERCPEENSIICDTCSWAGCINCGDGTCCENCGNWICGDCTMVCKDCTETFCKHCVVTCINCDENLCKSCAINCALCDQVHCSNCSIDCYQCDQQVCPSCTIECQECEEKLCANCACTCDECNAIICSSCQQKCCDNCGKKMCSSCLEKDTGCLLKEQSC